MTSFKNDIDEIDAVMVVKEKCPGAWVTE